MKKDPLSAQPVYCIPCYQQKEQVNFLLYLDEGHKNKTKGDVILYCPVCTNKHTGFVTVVAEWLQDVKAGKIQIPGSKPQEETSVEQSEPDGSGASEERPTGSETSGSSDDPTSLDPTDGSLEAV